MYVSYSVSRFPDLGIYILHFWLSHTYFSIPWFLFPLLQYSWKNNLSILSFFFPSMTSKWKLNAKVKSTAIDFIVPTCGVDLLFHGPSARNRNRELGASHPLLSHTLPLYLLQVHKAPIGVGSTLAKHIESCHCASFQSK